MKEGLIIMGKGRQRQRERQKRIWSTTLHVQYAFLEHFFAVTARLRPKIAFTFSRVRQQTKMNFSFTV